MIGTMLTSCSRGGKKVVDSNNALVGSWKHENGKTLIFQKDGGFIVITHQRQGRGTYKVLDPTHFRITIPLNGTNSVTDYKFSILNGDMTLESAASGSSGTLHRVQN
jgi:hypothetical protein